MHISIWKYICIAAGICFNGPIYGAWSSGGGELIGDSENPWFSNSVRSATYCIEVDESKFGLSEDRLKTLVAEGFSYWRQELSSGKVIGENGFTLSVMPTSFLYQSRCSDLTDIRFQFGTLSDEQLRLLRDPTQFVAVAFRTAYDEVDLRGQGFVYVSPESGPLRLSGKDVQETPWSFESGRRLRYILLHELGHIFGIPHRGRRYTLMSAAFPEIVVQKNTSIELTVDRNPQVFRFREGTSGYGCDSQPNGSLLHRLLGLSPEFPCVKTRVDADSVEFYLADDGIRNWHLARRISVSELEDAMRSEETINLRLSDRQNVFPGYPSFARYISGPRIVHQKRQGSFRNQLDGEHGTVEVDLSPGCFVLSVVRAGKLYSDLVNTCL